MAFNYLLCYNIIPVIAIILHCVTCIEEINQSNDPGYLSISQISPKSMNVFDDNIPISASVTSLPNVIILESALLNDKKDNAAVHRVERSAAPIINQYQEEGRGSGSGRLLHHMDTNDVESAPLVLSESAAAAGRYHNLIEPTSVTAATSLLEMTKTQRMGKNLEDGSGSGSFLSVGGPRSIPSGSPIPIPLNSAPLPINMAPPPPKMVVKHTSQNGPMPMNHAGSRQNPNPDIQDIITGIVKLLNGNVNVHANTQGSRRPVTNRINNRGPPRISDTQLIPEFENNQSASVSTNGGQQQTSTSRPPPYPFERPDGPVRPFLTGVPLPEQIVPSMQQNYRPGFVSQNRPPWQRPRPRPPINGGSRRPIPAYKPMPPMPEYKPEDDMQLTTSDSSMLTPPMGDVNDEHPDNSYDGGSYEIEEGTDDLSGTDNPSFVTEFNTELQTDNNQKKDDSNDNILSLESFQSVEQPFKDELSKKKDKNNSKQPIEKKPINPVTGGAAINALTTPTAPPSSPIMKTIIESKSEVNEVQKFITTTQESTYESTIHQLESSIIDDIVPSNVVLDGSSTTSRSISSSINQITSTSIETPALFVPLPTKQITNHKASIPYPALSTSASSDISFTNQPSLPTGPSFPYHPRPGIVLDDPEFKPGGHGSGSQNNRPQHPQRLPQRPPQIQPTRPNLPPGYGEIFDVTLSAIQGMGGSGSGVQTVNIKPAYGGGSGSGGSGYAGSGPGSGIGGDIIISPSGDQGFVSIDGKRTYINLFGEATEVPPPAVEAATATLTPTPTQPQPQQQQSAKPPQSIPNGVTGSGYAAPDTETGSITKQPLQPSIQHGQQSHRPLYRPRPTPPPVRIDTCIVGDDSTCDLAQNEKCKTDSGVSSCHCRPGYARRKHREPCRRVVSLLMSLRVDKIYDRRVVWDKQLSETTSEPYTQLSYETMRAIDSAMSMTPFSDEFLEARVNKIYNGDATQGTAGVFVNLTLKLEENGDTLRPGLKADIQRHLLGVIHRRNNNIGNSALFVESPPGSISNLQDLDECTSAELNDCHPGGTCTNVWGSFRCECPSGFRDPWADQPQRAGRDCQSCPESYCNNRGTCGYDSTNGGQVCTCISGYYGAQCEIDGEVLGVAIGASVAAVIIIVLTLICLVMWSRRWHREQKNAIGSPIFGYMAGAQVKTPAMGQAPYQVTLEDRMRWAQIADVMAQANHYAAEPVGSTRPSSAMFGYPNLQTLSSMNTLATMSMAGTMPMHNGTLPPVPLPRLGLHSRSNGMRTLENSSSSEEEDRADLLGRNFQVPRPKSRSNGSIANQSGIYYDVDYEPSRSDMYGPQHQTNGSQTHGGSTTGGIPMSTYTAGRPPSSYYMK